MKIKQLLSVFSFILAVSVNAQVTLPHYEPFNYTVGDTLPWNSFNSGDSIVIMSGNLSYSGLQSSTGNMIVMGEYGKDYQKQFTEQGTGTTTYYSFLLKVTDLGALDATGGYFAAFTESQATTYYGASLWLRLSGSAYNVGINARTTAAYTSWASGTYNVNDVLLIVVSYQLNSGSTNDVVKLWINPTNLGGTAPTENVTITNGGTDLIKIANVLLRQDSHTETPEFMNIDELRIGNSYADVTPAGTVGLSSLQNTEQFKVYPSCVRDWLSAESVKPIQSYKIISGIGIVCMEGKHSSNRLTLNLNSLTPGIYFAQFTVEDGTTVTRKIVKK